MSSVRLIHVPHLEWAHFLTVGVREAESNIAILFYSQLFDVFQMHLSFLCFVLVVGCSGLKRL